MPSDNPIADFCLKHIAAKQKARKGTQEGTSAQKKLGGITL
jgi:D-alanyl-D-alanine carboxypeptidase